MPLRMSALNANAPPFSIRSNAFRILTIEPAICCQPASLFLTTSQAGGIAMIFPWLTMTSNSRLTTFVGMLVIFRTYSQDVSQIT